jgi:sugar lactone lactonase YvrE
MPPRIAARPFFRPDNETLRYLPECPRAIGDSLFWVSIQYGHNATEGGLNILDLATRRNRHIPLPGRPGFFVESAPGELVIGLERRLVRFDIAGTRIVETLADLPDDPRVIINDGVAIPGGVLFGTKDLAFKQPIAALYHYDYATRRLRQLLDHQLCSNGKYLHDGLLVDIDSGPRTITEYRYSDGALQRTRLIAPPESLPAVPDGLRPTQGGDSIVVAFVNLDATADGLAQEIRLADGAVLTEWTFPGAPRVTCPEFITLDGRPHLLFTTACEGSESPECGTLFVAPVG